MRLNTKYPPTPENAAQHAEQMVQASKEISGVDLDFSPKSLEAVDKIIEELRREGVSTDEVAETLFGFGCYVGELFVRNNNGKWIFTEDTPMRGVAGCPIVVELAEKHICNPIGKAFKRLENGKEDSLPYFYHVFTRDKQG